MYVRQKAFGVPHPPGAQYPTVVQNKRMGSGRVQGVESSDPSVTHQLGRGMALVISR